MICETPPTTNPAAPGGPAGYDVLGVLGRGGMGVVYRARHRALGRQVALKTVPSRLVPFEAEARLRLEARALARLEHPHIVGLHEAGEHEGVPWLALELVEGESLARRLKDETFRPAEAARLVATLAAAVHHAHRRGVVHRDLKPANILFTKDGAPKIADFGLARVIGELDRITATGDILGSPHYMAPEQASGRTRESGPAADVHALGTLLYQLLTGSLPFSGDTPAETMHRVRTSVAQPPRCLARGVSRDLEAICLKCLEKDPGRRYATAAALGADLARFLAGEPVAARRTGLAERAWKWLRRRPSPAILAAGFTAGLALARVVF